MNAELLFIYDSHCPWSYATTSLVNEIANHLPELKIHFWHSALFSAAEFVDENKVSALQVEAVKQASKVKFSPEYLQKLATAKDSTLSANLLAWSNHKASNKTLALLNALQQAHFQQGVELKSIEQVQSIIDELKLSPPAKALSLNKLSKDANFDLQEIFEIQEIINTKAIPALLLAHDDNLTLLSHNLYLTTPHAIVEAIKIELNQ
jgi:putative protein-disulfide isomerase